MKRKEKIIVYESIIETIKKHKYENVYVCNELNSFLSDFENSIEKNFPEYFLFRENNDNMWLNEQLWEETRDCISYSETSYIINQYRIFILQLCIEMCK